MPALTYTGKSISLLMKVISVVGYKKSGKTALVSALVRNLSGFGTVGTVKHMGEQRLNPAETDTGRHFDAGADMVIGITGTRTCQLLQGL